MFFLSAFALSGCAFWLDKAPVGPKAPDVFSGAPEYLIGPGDTLQDFVWRSAELSVTVPVRPDGRFSMPLLQDIQAAGKSPSQISEEIKHGLSDFMHDPMVTVIVQTVQGLGAHFPNVAAYAHRLQARPAWIAAAEQTEPYNFRLPA